MMDLSRRGFVTAVSLMPLLAGCVQQMAARAPILLYDPALPWGQEFASRAVELKFQPVALEGDRVPMLRTILSTHQPSALWGLSRHADQMLVSDIAREHGYRPALAVQHLGQAPAKLTCQQSMQGAATIATLSGGQWPTTFAELAAGHVPICDHDRQLKRTDQAMSWVLAQA